MRVHYPRTPHLPWSPGATSDDVRVTDLSGLTGREIVVTEKLDGENTTLYPDGLHARSLDSAHHPSRAWVKALHGRIAHAIPAGWRVCGENVYARHSIAYQELASWFYAFSVWTGGHCLDWDSTVRFSRRLGVPVPPVLWRGTFSERTLRALRLDTGRQEGYVVRTVDGFDRAEFAHRVAKWVRPRHVRTDRHWMLGPVVENGLGPAAPLWDVRSGAGVDLPALLSAAGTTMEVDGPVKAATAEVCARLDLLGRRGDARLAGVLATLLHRADPSRLAPRLVAPLGVPLARRVADLVGLHVNLHRPFPDHERRTGLVRLAGAVDLGVLHAVARSVLAGRDGPVSAGSDEPVPAGRDDEGADAAEQVDWSALHAEEAGLLGEAPLEPLRAGLRAAVGCDEPDVADRRWAEARAAYALGRIHTVEEAVASTWRWRDGNFPRLVLTVGPSGSGKSSFARSLSGVDTVVSLDELRRSRGSRGDQRANPEVLREALHQLDTALTGGATVVWDATSLNRQQRSLVHTVADRRDALVTHAVLLVPDERLTVRNAGREHAVPAEVLDAQLRRFRPPWPGEAHRTWYVGPDGLVGDVAGMLSDGED